MTQWDAVIVGAGAAGLFCAGVAGQLGLFKGQAPNDLGVRDGRLKPPSMTDNSVSSQASLFPDHPQRSYATMEPLRIQGDAGQAMRKLAGVLRAQPRIRIVVQDASYLRAEAAAHGRDTSHSRWRIAG